MPWAAGSYTKGNSGTGGWTGDASLGIGIEAGRHDTQDNDFATGINQCINKDGSNAFTGNPNLGGFIPTNLAAGTAAAPAICAGNDVNTGIFSPAADTWALATNGVERVRVDSSGRVGIGETSPVEPLVIKTGASATAGVSFRGNNAAAANEVWVGQGSDGLSGFIYARGNGDLIVGTNNSERMRILSNGVFCVGTGSSFIGTAGGLCVKGGGATGATYSFATSNSASGLSFSIANDGAIETGVLTNSPYNRTTGSAANMFVSNAGSLLRSTSSLRYKTDVRDYTNGLSTVDSLRPVFYKGKNDGDKQFAGLIAEEVHEAGLTEFVVYNEQNEPDALQYGNMVALAFKAIQELNAKVEALQARVTELEGA
jgi:hypothetical protein